MTHPSSLKPQIIMSRLIVFSLLGLRAFSPSTITRDDLIYLLMDYVVRAFGYGGVTTKSKGRDCI
jgi:hypothetical protein